MIFPHVYLDLRNSRLDLGTVNFHCGSTQIINGHSGIILVVTINGGMEIYTLIWGLAGFLEVFFMFYLLHHLIGSIYTFTPYLEFVLFFNPRSFLPSFNLLILVVSQPQLYRHFNDNYFRCAIYYFFKPPSD